MQIIATFALCMGTIKHCPRCGAEFVCNAEDKWHCQCAKVVLNDSARTYLAAHYTDCLCINCLRQLAEELH